MQVYYTDSAGDLDDDSESIRYANNVALLVHKNNKNSNSFISTPNIKIT